MSNIIKSAAVVHDFPGDGPHPPGNLSLMGRPVIKRRTLSGQAPAPRRAAFTKDALLDELNRLRLEIGEAEKELIQEESRAADIRREVGELEEKREALKQMDGMSIDDQAKAILRQAENEAAQIVRHAQEQAADAVDQLKAQGYLDGLQQGASEARETYYTQHEPDIHKLEFLMTSLSSMKEEMIRENETDIISLVIAVSEKVIGRALDDDPSVVVDMLREVMDLHRRESFVKVTISPDLLPAEATVEENILAAIQDLGRQINILVDSESSPGAMIVETGGGFTDLSIETQLHNLHEILLED